MYLEHFGLREPPFSLTPDTGYFFGYGHYRDAMETLVVALKSGEGFIKVTGEVGTGKTLLCRKLLNTLDDTFYTAYIPNPYLTASALNLALADELDLDLPRNLGQHRTLKSITRRLIELANKGKQVVLCVDEAQSMPDETLEAMRLLTNLETEKRKLLQVVLFGQPELDERLRKQSLRQLRQRITFSYRLEPMDAEAVAGYVIHRLAVAGGRGGVGFSARALGRLYRASGGIPRLVNILANKSLMAAYGKGSRTVSDRHVKLAVADTESAHSNATPLWRPAAVAVAFALLVIGVGTFVYRNSFFDGELIPFLAPKTESAATVTAPPPALPTVMLKRIKPPALRGSWQPRTMVLEGSGFDDASRVEVGWSGGSKMLEPQQVVRLDDNRLAITITTGVEPDRWSARVISAGGEYSNEIGFLVSAPPGESESDAAVEKRDAAAPSDEHQGNAGMLLQRVTPSLVEGSWLPRTFTLEGAGFDRTRAVEVTWSGGSKLLEAAQVEQVEQVDDGLMTITITTGTEPDRWSARLLGQDGGRSNAVHFSVAAGGDEPQPKENATGAEAAAT